MECVLRQSVSQSVVSLFRPLAELPSFSSGFVCWPGFWRYQSHFFLRSFSACRHSSRVKLSAKAVRSCSGDLGLFKVIDRRGVREKKLMFCFFYCCYHETMLQTGACHTRYGMVHPQRNVTAHLPRVPRQHGGGSFSTRLRLSHEMAIEVSNFECIGCKKNGLELIEKKLRKSGPPRKQSGTRHFRIGPILFVVVAAPCTRPTTGNQQRAYN